MVFINRDINNFHPEVKQSFTHLFANHPLFQYEEIKKLALRHQTVRYHSSRIPRSQSFEHAAKECPNGLSLEETMNNIHEAGAFVYIQNVEKDPIYSKLMHEILDEIEPQVHRHHKNLCNRLGSIFVTSPGGTTPYHRDQESSHYFHVKGKKTFYLWDLNDKDVVNQLENEDLHGAHSLKKVKYKDALMEKATRYDLGPGQGLYFPYTAPHMVENGTEEFAISFSVSHMTDENYKIRRINKMNQLMRKVGMSPRDLRDSAIVDQFKLGAHWVIRKTLAPFNNDWRNA